MEWLVTHEISKDPEIYGDEKKTPGVHPPEAPGIESKDSRDIPLFLTDGRRG